MARLLLTPAQAARTLGVSVAKLRALLASGEIASIRVGTDRQSTRIAAAALQRWVDGQAGEQSAEREPAAGSNGGVTR